MKKIFNKNINNEINNEIGDNEINCQDLGLQISIYVTGALCLLIGIILGIVIGW